MLRSLDDPSKIRITLKKGFLASMDSSVNQKQRFQIIDSSTGSAHTMNLTELAGTAERWLHVATLYTGSMWSQLLPVDVMSLNLDMGDKVTSAK